MPGQWNSIKDPQNLENSFEKLATTDSHQTAAVSSTYCSEILNKVMDSIMKIVEAGETAEEFDFNSVDQEKLKMFQSKCTVWDYNNMLKGEYLKKSESEKKDLFISYYNHMVKGMHLFLLSGLSEAIF